MKVSPFSRQPTLTLQRIMIGLLLRANPNGDVTCKPIESLGQATEDGKYEESAKQEDMGETAKSLVNSNRRIDSGTVREGCTRKAETLVSAQSDRIVLNEQQVGRSKHIKLNTNESRATRVTTLRSKINQRPRIRHKMPTRMPSNCGGRSQLTASLLTIPMCHWFLATVCLLLANQLGAQAVNDELLALAPFAPTRAPQQSSTMVNSNNNSNNNSNKRSLQWDPKAVGNSGSSSNTKFTKINELDVFLDDMNHNELRAIAAGKPIGDLFHPKPIAPSSDPSPANSAKASSTNLPEELARKPRAGSGLSGPNNGGQLDQSQSERQIYSECALILQRTYVKNIDDPKHQLVPFGKTEQACISYKHIDKAIEQAKHQLKFRELAKKRKQQLVVGSSNKKPLAPFEIIHSTLEPPEDLVAAVGEINMATTQILADQFDLSNDELLNGLPLIDMSKTKFWSICPLLVRQDIKCELSRFRTMTGHCNNLKHPTWGAAMTPFARYLPPLHPDGIWIPRKSIVTEVTFDLTDGHREMHSNIESPTMPNPVFVDQNFAHAMHHEHHAHATHEMTAAPSVQFIRHAQPDGSSSSLPDNQVVELAGGDAAHNQQHQQPATAVHYQQSVSPSTPFMASTKPVGSHNQQPLVAAASNAHQRSLHSGRSLALELPSPRLVSSVVHRDVDLPNHDFSILFMSWGQLLDHDMTRAAQPPSSIKCCQPQEGPKHKLCLPIQVPENDPFYSKFNVKCLEFRRSLAGVRPNCVLGPRVHQNAITAPIDANFVYGSSQAQAQALRAFKGGRLRSRDWFKRQGLKPLLPAQDLEPDLECIARPKDLFCFLAGDVRANEQTHLTVLHTLYMREHNRMADKLAELNPHWDDERTYQETRHIMAAGVQHTLINEYIPLLIGKKMTELYNLTAQSSHVHFNDDLYDHNDHHHHHHHNHQLQHYWHGYDPSVTTSVSNSFAAAAFRQGHTFVQGSVQRYNKFHEFVASEKLRHLFKQPFLIYQPGVLDELTGGMINQPSQSNDPFISEDIAGHLFQPPESQFGHDLPSINLQRGREQGLPGYNLFREWCGLPRAETFDQLEPYLTNHTAYLYSRLYKHVDDIDLWSGGVSERKLPGAAIGPTFACIIARQFSNTRRGDRFWYENPGLPSSFTPQQLAEIRKISLAKILCANSDDLPTIQRWALRMPHPVLNPRIPCDQLPEPNLQYWQEE